jgi:hypothetical protein
VWVRVRVRVRESVCVSVCVCVFTSNYRMMVWLSMLRQRV